MLLSKVTTFFSLTLLSSQATAYSIRYPRSSLVEGKRTVNIVKPRDTDLSVQSANSTSTGTSPELICYILGSDCEVVNGQAIMKKPINKAHQVNSRAIGTEDENGNLINGPGHPDGNTSHIYTVSYDQTVVPIGVCNPKLFGQYVMDYGCKKGTMDSQCRAKAEWPCNYQDDSTVGATGWDPLDDGQADVRKCTMGIEGHFGTSYGLQLPGQDSFMGLIDFLKDFTIKAMEPPMQVDGGNTSVSPMPHGNGSNEPNGPAGRNVTVYQFPASMTVAALRVIPGDEAITPEGFNHITVTVSIIYELTRCRH